MHYLRWILLQLSSEQRHAEQRTDRVPAENDVMVKLWGASGGESWREGDARITGLLPRCYCTTTAMLLHYYYGTTALPRSYCCWVTGLVCCALAMPEWIDYKPRLPSNSRWSLVGWCSGIGVQQRECKFR